IPAATTGGGLAYKFIVTEPSKAAPWKLAVATESVEPWVRAEVVNWVTLTETLVTGRSLVRYDIQNAPVKELRVKVPAAFKNVELNGADIRRRDQNGEEWRVELQNKTRGYYYLVVSWELPCTPAKTGLELAGVEAVGVERESGGIAILARPPLQVEGAPVGSDLLQIDASELPDLTSRPAPDRAIAMSARKTEMEAKLDNIVIPKIEFKDTSIVDVINFLTDQSREIDAQKTGGAGVNIVLGGGVGTVGGPQAPGITLNLRNVPLRDALRYVTDIAGMRFRIEEKAVLVVPCSYMPAGSMQTRSYRIQSGVFATMIGDHSRKASSEEVKKFFIDAGVPFPAGASVSYQESIGMLFVTNTPEGLETFEQVLSSLNISSGRAQTNAPSARVDDSVVLAYRYLRPGWKLKLTAKRFKEAEVLQALVDSARLTTVVAEDGQTMTMLTLAVRNNGRQYLEVTLPPGAQVWSAFVGGQAVRPTKREAKLLLPLERSGEGDAPVSVELTYVSAEKFPAASGRFEMATPAVDVPLKNARWEMYVPPNYRVTDFEGTMTHEDIVSPLVQVFSLGEYERVENVQQQMREAEVSSFLSSARSNIAAGKAKVAMDNYNRAIANAGQGASFAKNAADLKDIGEQLRQSQAANVQNNDAQLSFFGAITKSGAGTLQLGIQPAQQPVPQADTDAAAKQYDKLQQAQELAVARVLPLRVNLPTHGAKHAFTQVLQTEVGKPMTVRFHATNTRATGWFATAGMSAAAFVVLWILAAVMLGRRQRA
ncbi:MAG: STN domain-containing protein, partial [Verrucomicrobia bacterium]|nr:STN domain-containing protein [Verrucomicrobiota bacterium]